MSGSRLKDARPRRGATSLVAGLMCCGLIASCVGSSETRSHAELDRLGLTRSLPAKLTDACRRIQRRVDIAVYCPPVVPESHPPPPQIEQAGPLGIGFSHGRVTRWTRDYYEANVQSGSWLDHASDGHWIFAAGSPRLVGRRINALPLQGPPTGMVASAVLTSRNVRIAGLMASVKRMARYPQGGINGGHVLVTWKVGATDYLVSIHGFQNEPRAVAMAEGLINEIRSCPLAAGPVISGCNSSPS